MRYIMQQIKWSCDRCKTETNKLSAIRIDTEQNKPTEIKPQYNGLFISGDGIKFQYIDSITYELCGDCISKVKDLILNV